MEQQEIEEVLGCLSQEPDKFYYFKDFYAVMMLSYVVGSGMKIHEIKKSRFKRLINKPLVKELLRTSGSPTLSQEVLGSFWPRDYHCYLLTLDKWGEARMEHGFIIRHLDPDGIWFYSSIFPPDIIEHTTD